MADKVDAEVTRIREMLVRALEENRFSVRSVERKLGSTVGARRKVLRGQSPLTVRHLLEMLEAIGLPWETFFHALYPPSGQKAPVLGRATALGAREPGKAGQEATAPAALDPEEQRAERVLRRVFARMLDELLKDGQD